MPDTLWFWQIFPTVLTWCANGSDIQVYVMPVSGQKRDKDREKQRRGFLQSLGAKIHEMNTLPFYGFWLRRVDNSRDALFLKNLSSAEHASFGTAYVGAHHQSMINIIEKQLDIPITNTVPQIKLQLSQPKDLIDRLKSGVWQYAQSNVSINLEEVQLDQVNLLVRRIRMFKFSQIDGFANLHDLYKVPKFCPAAVIVDGQIVSHTTPPILEECGDRLVAIEGNTRTFYLYKKHVESMWAFVVRGVKEPLPGCPVTLDRVLPYMRHLESSQRIDKFHYPQFRSIESAARPLETQV